MYDPNGTITGGSRSTEGKHTLERLQELRLVNLKKSKIELQHKELINRIEIFSRAKKEFRGFKSGLELKQAELSSLMRQFEVSAAGKTSRRMEELIAELNSLQQIITEQSTLMQSLEKQVEVTERDISDLAGDRQGKLRSIQVNHCFLGYIVEEKRRIE